MCVHFPLVSFDAQPCVDFGVSQTQIGPHHLVMVILLYLLLAISFREGLRWEGETSQNSLLVAMFGKVEYLSLFQWKLQQSKTSNRSLLPAYHSVGEPMPRSKIFDALFRSQPASGLETYQVRNEVF